MTRKIRVEAVASREGDWWVVDITGYGATQTRRLDDVEPMVADLVASLEDIDVSAVEVTNVVCASTGTWTPPLGRQGPPSRKQQKPRNWPGSNSESWCASCEHVTSRFSRSRPYSASRQAASHSSPARSPRADDPRRASAREHHSAVLVPR